MSCVCERERYSAIPTIPDLCKEGENGYCGKVVFAI